MKCIICSNKKFSVVWFDRIREGQNLFSKKKVKILKCNNCSLVFLKKKISKYENNNKSFRKKFDGDSTIKKYLNFHKPREIKKFKSIFMYLNFKNKRILESNCGYGVIIDYLKKISKVTAGIDHKIYKNTLKNRKHEHFENIDEVLKSKKNFDIIFCLSELEHKVKPIDFLKKIKKIMKNNQSKLIIRVPNYDNIYKSLIGKNFLKYDFRSSHNFYFSEVNLDLMFKKLKFRIIKKLGHQEYSINHLLTFFKKNKRIKEQNSIRFFSDRKNNEYIEKIQKNKLSTSLIYILSSA